MLDEYTIPYLKATQLNEMCDGNYQYPSKGGEAIKLKKPLIIICSNKPMQELYPNACVYLEARFNQLNVDPPFVPYMFKGAAENVRASGESAVDALAHK